MATISVEVKLDAVEKACLAGQARRLGLSFEEFVKRAAETGRKVTDRILRGEPKMEEEP